MPSKQPRTIIALRTRSLRNTGCHLPSDHHVDEKRWRVSRTAQQIGRNRVDSSSSPLRYTSLHSILFSYLLIVFSLSPFSPSQLTNAVAVAAAVIATIIYQQTNMSNPITAWIKSGMETYKDREDWMTERVSE